MLLGDLPKGRFVAEYYQRLPYSAVAAAELQKLLSWPGVVDMLAAESADVFICRRNEPGTGPPPQTEQAARQLLDSGHTLLVRHAERHDRRLEDLAAAFERDFAAAINIHVYCTPAGEYGFGWHYDAEEVFILQLVGRKQYALRKNTVHPWPLEETLPADMHYEREIMPLWKCDLASGSWLYIPSGYWHRADASEWSLSLAIGVQPRAALEVLDLLRAELRQSLVWRQRLPVAGDAAAQAPEQTRSDLAKIVTSLCGDLAARLSQPRQIDALVQQLLAQNLTHRTTPARR